jgi:hypothetical protein
MPLPDTTLRLAGVTPPICAVEAVPYMSIPTWDPAMALPPLASVPIRLPWITWPVPPGVPLMPKMIPLIVLPEITLRAAGVAPPIVTPAGPPFTRIPKLAFP